MVVNKTGKFEVYITDNQYWNSCHKVASSHEFTFGLVTQCTKEKQIALWLCAVHGDLLQPKHGASKIILLYLFIYKWVCLDCKLGAQDAGACLFRTVHVCRYVRSVTCSKVRLLLFITRLVFVMCCLHVNGTSPRQFTMYILMSLANKLPCILVLVNMTVFCAEQRLEFCWEVTAGLSVAPWKTMGHETSLEQFVFWDFNWSMTRGCRKCVSLLKLYYPKTEAIERVNFYNLSERKNDLQKEILPVDQ